MTRPNKMPLATDPVVPAGGASGDPRRAPQGSPVALPDPDDRYPQTGVPYPDPDAFRLLSLDPPSAVIGTPDFSIRVLGQGFTDKSTIIWNGGAEPTTFVSPTELTTGVNMATVSGPYTVPISVRDENGNDTNSLDFSFTEAAAP